MAVNEFVFIEVSSFSCLVWIGSFCVIFRSEAEQTRMFELWNVGWTGYFRFSVVSLFHFRKTDDVVYFFFVLFSHYGISILLFIFFFIR